MLLQSVTSPPGRDGRRLELALTTDGTTFGWTARVLLPDSVVSSRTHPLDALRTLAALADGEGEVRVADDIVVERRPGQIEDDVVVTDGGSRARIREHRRGLAHTAQVLLDRAEAERRRV